MHTTRSSDGADSANSDKRLSICFTALFYGGLGILGIGWLYFVRPAHLETLFEIRSLPLHGILGLGLGGLVVLFSRLVVRRFTWARSMEEGFRSTLRDQPVWTVPFLALFSALGEEIFFRGALQEFVGVWLQAGIFGVVHFPFSRKMWAWPFFAVVMGLAFGAGTVVTGTLWMATVAHGTINGLNMRLILRKPEGEQS